MLQLACILQVSISQETIGIDLGIKRSKISTVMDEPEFKKKKMFGTRNATCFFNINICRIKILGEKRRPIST